MYLRNISENASIKSLISWLTALFVPATSNCLNTAPKRDNNHIFDWEAPQTGYNYTAWFKKMDSILSVYISKLELVIPTTNALPRWRLNVETKTKRTLYSSRRLSFNELTNAKSLGLHSSHFALNWRCCTAVRWASALAVPFENLGPPLSNVM